MRNLRLFLILLLPCVLAAGASAAAPLKVPRDAKFEAAFTLPDQTGNPFDPQDNDVDAAFVGPGGLRMTVPAFWDGDRWRVRFAPTRVGAYRLTLTRNGHPEHPTDLTAAAFLCVPSADPGFIRRDPVTAQRFVFDDGQAYYPLGMNVAWTGGNGPDYPDYFAHMGQAHMNWARVWMTYWDGKALEWSPDKSKDPPIGSFLLDAARRWDMIFDQAAQNGVYVQMVLQHHGQYTAQVDPNWADNPFNAANGGFLQHPDDFFTDAQARRLTRAKYRYIVARWGYSTHLLSFELFNEVQNIREAQSHFQDVVAWHREMAAYIRSLDVDHHLITTSISVPTEPLGQIGLDYDQNHTYPPDLVSVFAGVQTEAVRVPYFYGEWGPTSFASPQSEPLVHNGLWASLMAPTAGAGQYWSWDLVAKYGWWPLFASATGFVRTFDVPSLGAMDTLRPDVDAPGPRADLKFAPSDSWETTTRFDVPLPATGGPPNLAGVSSFIQGGNHRAMLPRPISFYLRCAAPSLFQITVGTVASAGAHPTLALDGQAATQADFPAAPKDHPANAVLTVNVPTGDHTVALDNTGQDWFVLSQVTVTNYVPAVAVLAKGNAHAAVFWAYVRPGNGSGPRNATLSLPGLLPGRYRVRLWDTQRGEPLGSARAAVLHGPNLPVPLHGLTGDVAGEAVRAP